MKASVKLCVVFINDIKYFFGKLFLMCFFASVTDENGSGKCIKFDRKL
jgi:hypothetical protein